MSEKIDKEYRNNFYETVNKKWIKNHPIPDDKVGISNFSIVNDKITEELKGIIKSLKSKKSLSSDEKKILDIYLSYVNIKDRDAQGIKPLKDELEMIASASSHKDIAMIFAKFQKMNIDTPLVFYVVADKKDSNINIVYLLQNGIALLKDYYKQENEKTKKEVRILEGLYSDLLSLAEFNNSKKSARNVVELESKIAKIQWSNIQNRNPKATYNIENFDALDKSLSHLEITKYLNTLGISKKSKFNVNQPSYFNAFNKLFVDVDVDVWKEYLRVKLLMRFGDYLTSDFSNRFAEYNKAKGFSSKQLPLDTRAINVVNENSGMLFGKLYVEKYFNKETKAKVGKLVKSIIDEYEIAIKNSKRLSKSTKEKALEKLHKMKFNIGYPDSWRDYASLQTKRNDLVYNLKKVAEFEHYINVAKLSKRVDKAEWDMSPQTVNAFYSPMSNKFVLLAGILNEPFFTQNDNDAVAYGGIGFIIGHEVGHAFDDQGSNFDADGNLNNWWTKEDFEKFNTLKKKLIVQANSYEILPNKFENGKLEIGEIIADLSGAEIALKAYLKVAKKKGVSRDKALKLFFAQLAQTWRSIYREQVLNMLIDSDPHPTSEFRTNGTLENMDLFYEAYGIKKGDFMYIEPSKRVKIW